MSCWHHCWSMQVQSNGRNQGIHSFYQQSLQLALCFLLSIGSPSNRYICRYKKIQKIMISKEFCACSHCHFPDKRKSWVHYYIAFYVFFWLAFKQYYSYSVDNSTFSISEETKYKLQLNLVSCFLLAESYLSVIAEARMRSSHLWLLYRTIDLRFVVTYGWGEIEF